MLEGQTPYHKAAMADNCDYLKKNAPSHQDLVNLYIGNTPLMWAIANSSISTSLELIKYCDMDTLNFISKHRNKNTPLILSIAKGWHHRPTQSETKSILSQSTIAMALLNKKVNVNAQDNKGRTAIHYACIHRNTDAMDALSKAGADWNVADNTGHKPLDYCAMDLIRAQKNLEEATGGSLGYTFSLLQKNFSKDSAGFFVNIRDLTNLPPPFKSAIPALLQQAQKANEKMQAALKPLNDWLIPYRRLFCIPENSTADKLNKLFKNLSAVSIIKMNLSKQSIQIDKTKIDNLLKDAFEDPTLKAEHSLLMKIAVGLANFISICCIGIPLLINFAITGHYFFVCPEKPKNEVREVSNNIHRFFSDETDILSSEEENIHQWDGPSP